MPPAHVQSKALSQDGNLGTITLAFDNNVVAGNMIFVSLSWDYSTANTVSPTLAGNGNTYTQILTTATDDGSQQRDAIYYAKNVAGGATTIVATFLGNEAFRRIIICEYSGLDTANPLDQAARTSWLGDGITTTTGTDGTTSKSITPSVNGCLVVGALEITQTGATIAAGTNFTERQEVPAQRCQVEDLVQTTIAAIQATWTVGTGSLRMNNFVASFKPPVIPVFLHDYTKLPKKVMMGRP